jgi:hypothetical protein
MRLNEFLSKEDFSKKSEEICNIIRNECFDFVAESYSQPLYRATYSPVGHYRLFQGRAESGRIPRNTPQWIHDYLNDLFIEHLGWKVRDGVSTIGHESGYYGTAYLFFPVGEYQYAWAEDIDDIYVKMSDIAEDIVGQRSVAHLFLNKYKDEAEKRLQQLVMEYNDNDLAKAIHQNAEIVFNCKEYYLVSQVYWEDIRKAMKVRKKYIK